MPTSTQIEGSSDEASLKEVVLVEGGSIPCQTVTLPTADMLSPHKGGYTIQELENAESSATLQPAELTPQGSAPQIPILSSTSNPASRVSRSTPIPIKPLGGLTPTAQFLAATAPGVQPPVSVPYNPLQLNQTLSLAKPKRPVGSFVRSLLGTKQNNPPHTHPVHEAPNLTPPEPYEFREMTLGCRFGMLFNIYYRPYDAHKTHAFTLSSHHGPVAHHPRRYIMDRLTSKASYAHKDFWCPQGPAQGLQPSRRILHRVDVVQPPRGGPRK